jgi:hypothetical protein
MRVPRAAPYSNEHSQGKREALREALRPDGFMLVLSVAMWLLDVASKN